MEENRYLHGVDAPGLDLASFSQKISLKEAQAITDWFVAYLKEKPIKVCLRTLEQCFRDPRCPFSSIFSTYDGCEACNEEGRRQINIREEGLVLGILIHELAHSLPVDRSRHNEDFWLNQQILTFIYENSWPGTKLAESE